MPAPLHRLFCVMLLATAWLAFGAVASAQPGSDGPLLLDTGDAPPPPALVTSREKAVQKYDSGQVRFEREVAKYSDDSFVNNGSYKEYYESGQLFIQGGYKMGSQTGEWTYFHPDGSVAKKVTFADGKPDGVVEVRRADGTLSTRREFDAGTRVGKWLEYDASGEQLLRESYYEAGKPTGVWKAWHKDGGKLARETTFKNGLRDGKSSEWGKDGSPIATAEFKAGKRDGLTVEWDDKGQKTERLFKDGKLQSPK